MLSIRSKSSFEGFSRLFALREALGPSNVYFDRNTSNLFNKELGLGTNAGLHAVPLVRDQIAVGQGFNEELLAFPTEALDDVVEAAGFKIKLVRAAPPRSENGGQLLRPTPLQKAILEEFEQHLRMLIMEKMHEKHGDEWLNKAANSATRKQWLDRKESDSVSSRPLLPVLYYADFWDLHNIIIREGNWEIFSVLFIDKDDFSSSMRRLRPIRHALAHHRPFGKSDVITIVSETARLMMAMGHDVLIN